MNQTSKHSKNLLFWQPIYSIFNKMHYFVVTMLVKDIPQNISILVATMFTLIALGYLILTFKVKRSGKIPDIF